MPSGRRRREIIASLIAAAAALFVWSASVQAATVLVGSPMSQVDGTGFVGNNGASVTVANIDLPEPGAHATSPVNGTIVSWHVISYGTGDYALRVIRPASGGSYTGVGTSVGHIDAAGDHTFTASLPIQTGDYIGLDLPNNQGVNGGIPQGASWVYWSIYRPADPTTGILFDGQTAPITLTPNTGSELAFNATVQYPDPSTTTAKKCKKKKNHKRSAVSAKKKCKKKKKH